MYTPEAFKITDETIINKFIEDNPFAILTSSENGKIEVTHLPIFRLDDGKLYGHVSKENHHAHIDEEKEVCLIFNGEHAYISPLYYESDFNVPTWNYSAVHVYGKVKYIDEQEQVWSLLEASIALYEGQNGWKLPQEENYKVLTKFIRFFEIEVTRIEAKFKFSQNKSNEDIEKVIMSLGENAHEKVADFMKKINVIDIKG